MPASTTIKPTILASTTIKSTMPASKTIKSTMPTSTSIKSTRPAFTTIKSTMSTSKTIKSTMPASTTVYSMSTESKNMTAGTIITNLEGWVIPMVSTLCEFILAVVMIVVGIIEIIRKFKQRLQNLLHRLENNAAQPQQDDEPQAALPAQDQPIAPLPAQNQPQPIVTTIPVLRRSRRQIKPVIRLNM